MRPRESNGGGACGPASLPQAAAGSIESGAPGLATPSASTPSSLDHNEDPARSTCAHSDAGAVSAWRHAPEKELGDDWISM